MGVGVGVRPGGDASAGVRTGAGREGRASPGMVPKFALARAGGAGRF
jgi:hypothetical protein